MAPYGQPARLLFPGDMAYMFGTINPPPYGNGIDEVADVLAVSKSVAVALGQPTPSHPGGTQRTATWEVTLLDVNGAQVSNQVNQTMATGLTFFRAVVTAKGSTTTVQLQAAMRDNPKTADQDYLVLDSMTLTSTSAATQIVAKMRVA